MTPTHTQEAAAVAWPFFSDRAFKAAAGKTDDEALSILGEYLMQAIAARDEGYGPSQGEMRLVLRRWQRLYEAWAARTFGEIEEANARKSS